MASEFAAEQARGGNGKATQAVYERLLRADANAGDIDALLGELEAVALGQQESRARAAAVLAIGVAGTARARSPHATTVERLTAIFERTQDSLVKRVVVSAMGTQVEARTASQFLAALAVAPASSAAYPDSQSDALASLIALGDEGRATLMRLHAEQAVTEPVARHGLSELAKRGFTR